MSGQALTSHQDVGTLRDRFVRHWTKPRGNKKVLEPTELMWWKQNWIRSIFSWYFNCFFLSYVHLKSQCLLIYVWKWSKLTMFETLEQISISWGSWSHCSCRKSYFIQLGWLSCVFGFIPGSLQYQVASGSSGMLWVNRYWLVDNP